ncbi:homeobox-leucine zipper protein ROC3-like [Phragmites australis]|uniref:homeobox-leucine zipper protein ROC3-like n=1 Tax=Phragmites australis TaxID=29695 RepID=UPI002D78350A|nr:homeobox-leucine zipper protein ROC3-like [Phragmites australis]XP_062206128.1 homeobox-leucine zipper protein ROC3-like [Phragmites australis]
MFGDCQVLSSMAAMAGASSSPDALFIPNPGALAGFMSSSAAAMPFHHFSTSAAAALIPKEEGGVMGALQVAKDEELELDMDMDMGLSGGSGSGHLDGLLSFADVDDDRPEQKPQHSGLDLQPADGGQQHNQLAVNGKKKRYHRHTAHQIQQMEALFKECPHPDDKQRLKLSQELGLKPRQVKFWFQNRRTQMKAQQDRADNVLLRAENESLKGDNYRLQAAIRNVVCPNCGHAAVLGEMSYEEQQLRIENARLKDELDRLACIATRYGGGRQPSLSASALGCLSAPPPVLMPPLDLDMSVYSSHFTDQSPVMGCGDLIHPALAPPHQITEHHATSSYMGAMAPVQEQDRQLVLDLAATAADTLAKMCRAGEPLWVRRRGASSEVMAAEEHARMFSWPVDGGKQGGASVAAASRTEGSRDSAVVIMNSITLVDAFLDANKWMELFPSIVSKARTIQVISHGAASGHLGSGSILLMQAEVQFPSPLVPAREVVFFRYCVHNVDEGTWSVVDFPAEGFQLDALQTSPVVKCRRRPSGCMIRDMPNGYSRVVWVEHMEMVGEEKPLHQVFKDYVAGGGAFGATRWVSLLQRQCERLASELARNIADLGVIRTPEARTNMMKLSRRMITTFCANISASGSQSWTALSESTEDTIRVTTRKNTDPGLPSGVILTAASTSWLPFSHQQVFELLADEQQRCQLEILSNGGSLHEVAHIANGSHPRNCISLLRINAASNSSQNVELLLQESSTHPDGGSLVVFATVDVDAIQVTMSGDDPSYIPLLPLGFAIFPATNPLPAATSANSGNGESSPGNADEPASGCLLTVGMQVLASAVPSAKLNLSSVTAINSHVCNTIHQITTALKGAEVSRVEAVPAGSD